MPRRRRWLVPFAALVAAALTRAGAQAAPQALPEPSVPAPEARTDRAAQARTVYALAERTDRRRAKAKAAADTTDRVVDVARAQVGDGYAWGGSGPDAFDCSGLTAYAFAGTDLALPHTSQGQAALGRPVGRDEIRRGDLVLFSTAGPGASHVGVATSADTVVSATNSGVIEHSLQDAYWGDHYVTARRVL